MTKEFCRHCGAEAPEDAQNCVVCGAPLGPSGRADNNMIADTSAGADALAATTSPNAPAQPAPPPAAAPIANAVSAANAAQATGPVPTPSAGVWAPPGQAPAAGYPAGYAAYPTYPANQAYSTYPSYSTYPAYPASGAAGAPANPATAQPQSYGYNYGGYGGYPMYSPYGAPWGYYAPYPYYAAGLPARRAPGETYALVLSWIVTVAAALGLLGGLLVTAIGAISAATGQADDLSFYGGILGFSLGPILGGAFGLWYGIGGIRRRPSPRFGMPTAWAILALTVAAIGGGLALWQINFSQGRPPGVAVGVLPLVTLAGALPALTILAAATQRMRNPSTRRHIWMSLFYGMTLAPLLAVILEVIASLIIISVLGLTGQDAQSVLGQPNTSNPSPTVFIALLLVLSVVAPLVEEGVKPLGALLAIRRLRTPAEAFLVGLAAGIGFDMLETIGYIGQGQADWVSVAIERIGAGLLHGVGAGMGALGWYYLINGSGVRLRWLRGIGCGVYAVLQHAVFNGLSLIGQFLPSGASDWLNQPYYIGGLPLQHADFIYLGLYLYLVGFLLFMTRRLLRAKGMPEREPPQPAAPPWAGPYAPYPAYPAYPGYAGYAGYAAYPGYPASPYGYAPYSAAPDSQQQQQSQQSVGGPR